MILTATEVQQLTGKARAHAQVAELKHLGIPFQRRRDGSVVVLRIHLEPSVTVKHEPRLRLG